MHELGVLGRYLPEWGALTCLVQYDVYHKFTADQHSLIAVQNLEALAPGQSPDSEGNAQVVSELERPGLLMLGMLLHDIGKGKGHGHVAKGIPLIEALTARIGLPAEDADKVVFLVAHHLTHVAHRPAPRHRRPEDDRDPRGGLQDSRAPAHALPAHLRRHARGGARGHDRLAGPDPLGSLRARCSRASPAASASGPRARAVAQRVTEAMRGDVARTAVAAHLALLSERYLTTTSPQRIAAHLRLLDRLADGGVLATELFHHPDLGSSELVVATQDVPGLFSLIAGTLAVPGDQHPLRPDPHPRRRHRAGHLPGERSLRRGGHRGGALAAHARGAAPRAARRGERGGSPRAAPRRCTRRGEGVAGPPKISVDNQISDSRTVVEVKCPDRVGLLYVITRTLSGHGLDIASARIATEIDQAYDTFYVTDRQGRRLEDEAAMARVRESLEDALLKPL